MFSFTYFDIYAKLSCNFVYVNLDFCSLQPFELIWEMMPQKEYPLKRENQKRKVSPCNVGYPLKGHTYLNNINIYISFLMTNVFVAFT